MTDSTTDFNLRSDSKRGGGSGHMGGDDNRTDWAADRPGVDNDSDEEGVLAADSPSDGHSTDDDLDGHSPADPTSPVDAPGDPNDSLRVCTLNVGQGLRKKLPALLQWATHSGIQVMALQETGACPHDYSLLGHFGYHLVLGPDRHAGVGLLIADQLAVTCTQELHYAAGRLVGAVLQSVSTDTLLVSAYMPTAMDYAPESENNDSRLCTAIYNKVLQWAAEARRNRPLRVVLLGDLNETCSPADRETFSRAARHRRFIARMFDAGFADAYRSLHPTRGWTSATPISNGRMIRSRIDYALTLGFEPDAVTSARIVDPPSSIRSSHIALVVDLRCVMGLQDHEPVPKPRLPNMRAASVEDKETMAQTMADWVTNHSQWISTKASGSRTDVAELGRALVAAALASTRQLPSTGGVPGRSKARLALARRRRALCQYRTQISTHGWRLDSCSDRRHQLLCSLRRCQQDLPPLTAGASLHTAAVVQKAIGQLRNQERAEASKMRGDVGDRWEANPSAYVHRMLDGDRPPDIRSVVDPATGQLHVDPTDVRRVLHQHFSSVFSNPTRVGNAPPWIDTLNQPQAHIDPVWYDGLMASITSDELTAALSDAKTVCAPGADRISSGVWRVLLRAAPVRSAVASLLSACFRLRFLPAEGKRSEIVPILKKKNSTKTVDNIRPISLQCSLYKIATKVLATRMGMILSAHPILHTAQDGFLPGGSSSACVDAVLDIWEHARENHKAVYNILYDIRAAYDSVRHDDLVTALQRLRCPASFVEFVLDSLTDLRSCVRTAYGDTDDFPVLRSIRQGDPLAPILFIMFLDGLHCTLHANPFHHGRNDGYRFGKQPIASKGYADDTMVISRSYSGLARLHAAATAWADWHGLRFHAGKTKLVGVRAGRDRRIMHNAAIAIDGIPLTCEPLDGGVTYLGAVLQLDLGWQRQVAAIGSMIGNFCHALERHSVRLDRAVWAINTFLIPKLAYRFYFVQPTLAQAAKWNTIICRCLSHLCGRVRAIKPEIWALVAGLQLPSYFERMVKISEMFFRLNGDPERAASARLRWASRRATTASSLNRLVRASALTAGIGWSVSDNVPSRRAWTEADSYPAGAKTFTVELDGCRRLLIGDHNGTWGRTESPWPEVTLFTDGSWSRSDGKSAAVSSWAVCAANDWLKENFTDVEEEGSLSAATRQQSVVFGGRIDQSVGSGNFDAELTAIARALMAVPVSCPVTLFSDSKSSLQAIAAYGATSNHRRRLRMAGRPLLVLITKVMATRAAAGARSDLRWVRAHSIEGHLEHVGNRLADDFAGRVTSIKADIARRCSKNLPTEHQESHVVLRLGSSDGPVLTSDPRRAAWTALTREWQPLWAGSKTQSVFNESGPACAHLWQAICTGAPRSCTLVMLAVSDTLHWCRPENGSGLIEEMCSTCRVPATVTHLSTCPCWVDERASASEAVATLLERFGSVAARTWLRSPSPTLPSLLASVGLTRPAAGVAEVAAASFGAFDQARCVRLLRKLGLERTSCEDVSARIRCMLFDWLVSVVQQK